MGLWWFENAKFSYLLTLLTCTSYFNLFCQRPKSQAVNNLFKKGIHVV